MGIFDLLNELINDYTLRTVALGSATLGIISGALGSFAVLRRQSLLGDALSHAALPGVALAFLLSGSKAPLVLVLGAGIAGWLATLLVLTITRLTRIKDDTALGLVLSVFFGFGMMLLTFIQRSGDSSQAGLDTFLFGQAAAMLERDVVTMALLGAGALLALLALWKEFKLLSFDPGFAASLGLPVRRLDVALTTLLVIAIVVGLQTVGVVLMSAMIVAPGAAARQWTDRLGAMVALSGLFGAVAGIGGALLSNSASHIPTGPTIVLCASAIALLSLAFAPNRGLLWSWLRRTRNHRRLRVETVLGDLFALATQHDQPEHGHSIAVLRAMNAGRGGVGRTLRELAERGWAREVRPDQWTLTAAGREQARARGEARGMRDEA